MGITRRLWLVIVACGCILMLQYHLSFSSTSSSTPSHGSITKTELSEPILLAAIARLQMDTSIINAVGEEYIKNLAYQLGKELLLAGCDPTLSSSSSADSHGSSVSGLPSPTLYIVTPTYRRPEQIPELTRLGQTLMHVPNLVWLVVEDANVTSLQVTNLLRRTSLPFYHLAAPMPAQFKDKKVKPRGVSNRNRALEWLRANATNGGVLYFADDDNTYDISLFEELRSTKRVSMLPVGLCTKFGVSSPVVVNGTIVGFYDGWIGGRKFPVDMAGFAVNLDFLFKRPKAAMPYKAGFEEDGFLRSLAPLEIREIELKASNCTKILVWHTQTKKNEPSARLDLGKYHNTNIIELKKILV